jgi:hypothetical protein
MKQTYNSISTMKISAHEAAALLFFTVQAHSTDVHDVSA